MRALLRFDASKDQGLGHLVRSMAIADAALAAGWDIEVCGDVQNAVGAAMIAERFLPVHPAPTGPGALAQLAASRGAALVHVDSYQPQGSLREALGEADIRLSSMEDGINGRRAADLVLDPSPASASSYRASDGSFRMLRGAEAIPLRELILALRTTQVPAPQSLDLNVLVVMGGTDARDLTKYLVEGWLAAGSGGQCHVVGQQGLVESWGLPESANVIAHAPGPEVPLLFPAMDLVITAAGTTIWELAYLGVPMAIAQVVENQRDNYEYAVSRSMAAGLGSFADGKPPRDDTIAILRDLRESKAARVTLAATARRMVDGKGSRNIVGAWSALMSLPQTPTARQAAISDAPILFDWRNEAAVRSVSRNLAELDWGGHVIWLQKVLADPARELFVVEDSNEAIGTVRFDAMGKEPAMWEVSITVSPHARGRGLGRAVLAAGEDLMGALHPGSRFFAEMLESNEASYRLFHSSGYAGPLEIKDGRHWHALTKTVRTHD